VQRITGAEKQAENKNCKPFTALFRKGVVTTVPCPQLAKIAKGFKVTGSRTYGTGALVAYTTDSPLGRDYHGNVFVAILDEHGRYVVLENPETATANEVSTRAQQPARFVAAYDGFVHALATRDCHAYLRFGLFAAGANNRHACLGLTPAYAKAWAANEKATGIRDLGGSSHVHFMAITNRKTGEQKATTYVSYNPQGNKPGEEYGVNGVFIPLHPATMPKATASSGGYTPQVEATYVKNCASGGESRSRCECEIKAFAQKVPYSDFKTPTARFDKARPAILKACKASA
jgi:hypothetical protein